MRQEAETNATQDRKQRERIEVQNQADSMIHATAEFLRLSGANLSTANRSQVEKAVEMLKQAIERNDIAVIKQRVETLQLIIKSMSNGSPLSSQPPRGFDPPKTKILD